MFEGFPEAGDNGTESHIPMYSEEEKVDVIIDASINREVIYGKPLPVNAVRMSHLNAIDYENICTFKCKHLHCFHLCTVVTYAF